MIPAYAHARLGCTSWLAGSGAATDFAPALRSLGVTWHPLGPGFTSRVGFVMRHARAIHVLHLYFPTAETAMLGLLFKCLHPSGKLWIKCDWSAASAAAFGVAGVRAALRRGWLSVHARGTTMISAESKPARESLEQTFRVPPGRVAVLSNGIDDQALAAPLPAPRAFDRKEQLVLSVGRIGAEEKNHGVLLEALDGLDPGEWRLAFVGPVEGAFAARAERLFERRPAWRGRVVFVGEVRSRSELYDWYDRARASCLPSWSESFGLVAIEALAFGHHLLLSDRVWSASEVTDGGRFGAQLPPDDPAAWRAALARLFAGELEDRVAEAAAHARETFAWSRILDDAGVRLGVLNRAEPAPSSR